MKSILKRAAIAIFVGLLPAGIAAAQVAVETPPGTGGAVNVQAGPAVVQTGPGGANVTVPPGTAAAIEDNAAARQENRIERRENRQTNRIATNNDWRMRRFNNRWWYWNPNNSWSYHNGTTWVPYTATRSYTAAQPAPARRYSSGYRGPMTTAPAPTTAAPANALPNTNTLPANRPATNGGPAPSSDQP